MYTMNMIAHLRAVRDYALHSGIKTELRMHDLKLEVSGNGRYYELVPGFIEFNPSGVAAYQVPAPRTTHFVGWRLHPLKSWDLASNKLAFKQYCVQQGLPVLRGFRRPEEVDRDVVVKSYSESTGLVVSAPCSASKVKAIQFSTSAYAEEFLPGDRIQAWYWDGRLACFRGHAMPAIVGDGRSSIQDLVATRRPRDAASLPMVEDCVRFQGYAMGEVAPNGREVFLDVRNDSPLVPVAMSARDTVIDRLRDSIDSQLRSAGEMLWRAIPADMRQNTLFTVSAVVDVHKQVWFGDMQSNPIVHPEAYPMMLGSLMGTPIPLPILAPVVDTPTVLHS